MIILIAGLSCSISLKAQADIDDGPGPLTPYPFFRDSPFRIGHCHVARCHLGMVVADEQSDSIFLLTTSNVIRSNQNNAGVVSVETVADFRVELPKDFISKFNPYMIFVGEDHAIRVFGWKYIGNDKFGTWLITIANDVISEPVGIGIVSIDSVALSERGNLEIYEFIGDTIQARLTILNQRNQLLRDTAILPARIHRPIVPEYPLSKIAVGNSLDPLKSGYFKSIVYNYDLVSFKYSTNPKIGYTWITDRKILYGVRNTVLQHLHSYERVAPANFSAVYDGARSQIAVRIPELDSIDEIDVTLIDFIGTIIAQQRVLVVGQSDTSFSTAQLKNGIYSVIASSGSKRGARTVRVR